MVRSRLDGDESLLPLSVLQNRWVFFHKEQQAMGTLPVFVGLDYSDAFVQVSVMNSEGQVLGNGACPNRWDAIAERVASYGTQVRAAIECGTGSVDLAEELTQRAGWSVDLAHPGFVRRMKQNPDKTDKQDATVLADLVRVGYVPRVWLPPVAIRELRQLVRYRQQLVGQRRQAKQQLRALLRNARQHPPEGVNPWTRRWWAWVERVRLGEQSRWVLERHQQEIERLNQEVRAVEQRLEETTAQDAQVQALRQHKGVGPVTAWTLRAELGPFDRFRTGKQMARFCGLSPCNASSGQREADSGLIKAANGALRSVLIEAAHRLGRLEPRWVAFKKRLQDRGKPGSVIAAAIANRWVRWLYYQGREAA
jgi:transposase